MKALKPSSLADSSASSFPREKAAAVWVSSASHQQHQNQIPKQFENSTSQLHHPFTTVWKRRTKKGVASNMAIYPYSKRWHLCPGLNILLYCLAPGLCHLFCQANIGWLLPEVCLAFTDNRREQSAYNLSLSFFENCKSLNHSCHFFLFTAQI